MSYTKTTWVSGEQITATKLNNAENGIENLDQRVENLEGHTGAFDRQSGSLLHFQDSINAQIRDIILYGKSTQNGTPTPSAPMAVNTAGDGGTLEVIGCGKNLYNMPFSGSNTTNGITFSYNSTTGTITANGTATANAYSQSDTTTNPFVLPAGTYRLYNGAANSTSSFFIRASLYVSSSQWDTLANDTDSNPVFTLTEPGIVIVRCVVTNGSTASNRPYMPMIVAGNTAPSAGEAFVGRIYPVTVPETGLPGIAVSSGENYTDSTGQQWVCDTIDLGRRVYTKRVHVVTFDGSEDWNVSNAGTSNWYYSLGNAGQLPQCPSISTPVLSSHYPFATISNSNTNQGICAGQGNTYGFVRVRYGSEDTKENFKTWLASNNLTLAYPMTNPIETALTDEQVAQLRAISTLKDETYMYNDGGSGMYVENYVNEKDLIDHIGNTVEPLAIKPTATGGIASFSDGSDGLPVKDLTIAINPKQAGSGDPSPSNVRAISGWTGANVTRTGKNLLKWENSTVTINGVTFTVNPDGSVLVNGTASGGDASFYSVSTQNVPFLAGQYILSGCPTGGSSTTWFMNETVKSVSDTGSGASFTLSDNGNIKVRIVVRNGTAVSNKLFTPMIRLASVSDATFESYQGTTYPITFPAAAGTVYGGSLDVTTGVLTVDRAIITLDGSQNVSASDNNRFYVNISEARKITNSNQSTDSSVICDKAKSLTWSKLASGTIVGDSMCCAPVYGNGVAFRWSTITSAADWKSYFTSNPTQFSYALNTPVTYHCTPTEVSTLLGANNIWADTGDSTVTYLADTKLYIDNAIAALQALVLEN